MTWIAFPEHLRNPTSPAHWTLLLTEQGVTVFVRRGRSTVSGVLLEDAQPLPEQCAHLALVMPGGTATEQEVLYAVLQGGEFMGYESSRMTREMIKYLEGGPDHGM